MRIKDFVHSPQKRQKTTNKFILSNEAKESRLEDQVKELQTELNKLSEISEKNRTLTRQATNFKSIDNRRRLEISSLEKNSRETAIEIERLQKFQRDNHNLTVEVKRLSSDLDNKQGTIELATINNNEKNKQLSDLQQRFDVLFEEEAGMRSELSQARNILQTQKVESAKHSKMYNEAKNLLGITQSALQGAKEQVKSSKHEEVFWQSRAGSLEQEVSQLKDVENNLRKWSDTLKEASAKTMGFNKINTKKLAQAQTTIAEMGDTINSLIKELKYTRELKDALQYEVSRPRYASMGAIAKNEGFVMPMGKENIRTQFLGNSTPKLLKFKEKHNDN
tara:strand:+ start:9157 stop:10161 length:1005 start_codon:yes stop_codon:yes gene_type:complete